MGNFIEKITEQEDYDGNSITTEFLHENHNYNIPTENISLKIAQDVLKEFQNTKIKTVNSKNELINVTTLINIPDVTEILRTISEKSTISVFSEPVENNAHELHFTFDGATLTLTALYLFGQIEYTTTYTVQTIKDENVRYLATENFIELCPDIPTIPSFYQPEFCSAPTNPRFYQPEFCSAKEALAALQNLKLHDKQNCQKELIIRDINNLQKDTWYLKNMKIIQILKNHPELDKPEYFHITPTDHLDCLEKHLNK